MIAMPNHLCKTVCSLGQFKVNHLGPTHWVNMDRDDVMYSIIHMKSVKYLDFSEKFQIYTAQINVRIQACKYNVILLQDLNNWEYQIKKQKKLKFFYSELFYYLIQI